MGPAPHQSAPVPRSRLRDMLATCGCLNARKAARLITQRYDEAFRELGIRATQLPILAMAGLEDGIALSSLAEALVLERTSLSRMVTPLRRRGWITIAPGRDRRVREVRLTPLGQDVLSRAARSWRRAQRALGGDLDPGDLQRLVKRLSPAVQPPVP